MSIRDDFHSSTLATQESYPVNDELSLNTIAYEFDYFSGTQISIYIGDILVDDIQSINFQVSQTKRPVYGYASQYYHVLATGQVLVEGAFVIPFKEADYILETLRHYQEVQPINQNGDNKQYQIAQRNIETMMRDDKQWRANMPMLCRDLSAMSDENFEHNAEEFEDHLWKLQASAEFLEDNVVSKSDATKDIRRGDQFPEFDIWILYGDISNKEANHTIKKIVSASIVGQGQVISCDGTPILEEYRFVARNLA